MTLVHSFISTRLDYCNSVLYDIADNQLQRLQSVQNAAARLVTGTRRTEHITPVLQSLQWEAVGNESLVPTEIHCVTQEGCRYSPNYVLQNYCRRVPFTEWNGPSCVTVDGDNVVRLKRCDVPYCFTSDSTYNDSKLCNIVENLYLCVHNDSGAGVFELASRKCTLYTHDDIGLYV